MQSLDKALDFFIALKFCMSDFYFLNRRKKCKVATYNIVSVYKWADISVNTGQIIFKFSTNINDMCVINFHLFYFELNKTLKNANEKFKFMVKSKFVFFQYFRRDQT